MCFKFLSYVNINTWLIGQGKQDVILRPPPGLKTDVENDIFWSEQERSYSGIPLRFLGD